MPEWKDTIHLPRTDFPMKANLPTAEPEMLARWEAMDLYGQIRQARHGSPKFVLHDGPPYANGNIHMGHALNKTLKDFVVKSRSMEGFDAPYVVGYDCHGLPIELQVDRELGAGKRDLTTAEFCRACRAYAERFIGSMTAQFQRLGVLGAWADPYLTMDFRYQAAIARALGRFAERGLVYKGKKPVHWCIQCRTALAEAEVEYESHTSSSIYVEFPIQPESGRALADRLPGCPHDVAALIWTTTPWTIPSNLAVAFHPELRYGIYAVQGKHLIVAEGRAEAVATDLGVSLGQPLLSVDGAAFEGLRFAHPIYDRDSIGVLADYVTLDAGTGAVHTAPGHGADDFLTGVKYGLDIYAPIGPAGHYLDTVERFAGLRVSEANGHVEAALREAGRLWQQQRFEHQYPHCWRCHKPVIFLATSQWFIAMDDPRIADGDAPPHTLRQRALSQIDESVRWIPGWGRDRIANMVANRPDWCISRQRAWGVPIPALDCTACGTAVLTPETIAQAASVFEQYGADAWYERPIGEFVPSGLACAACGGTSFEREMNILDVWFDSGSSHEAVLSVRPELTWPADIYIEGSDQHRGWFQSSLLVGLGTRGRAPFRDVLTHGFIVAEDGRKMSKSLGNSIQPQDVIAQSGADILRLWVSMSDFTQELRLGKEVLSRASEAYRKMRNTLRYLMANLYDFDPSAHMVPVADMEEVDQFMLARYAEVAQRVRQAYAAYEYGVIFHTINQFATVDLSAFYADVSKDRLYTSAATSRERRSGQSAMYVIADGVTRLLAPILSFTADEAWRYLPARAEASVHLARFPDDATLAPLSNPSLIARWTRLGLLRERVVAEIEPLRKDKVIGSSLQARVTLAAAGEERAFLESARDVLPMLFIVSEVDIVDGDEGDAQVTVARTDGVKCERCWRYVAAISVRSETEGLCPRCEQAVAGTRHA